ncbi:MAG: hypothetical protein IJ874_06690 [Ruminococcus sp.]|nr:hypothetical protein [Ruminococcus sp.]
MAENGTELPEREKQEKRWLFPWKWVNLLLGILFFLFLIIPVYTLGITQILFIPWLLSNLILAGLYRKWRETGFRYRRVVIARIAAVLLTLGIYVSPFICAFFNDVRLMYPVKKIVYEYGVYGLDYPEKCRVMLPETVPHDCDDYMMRTYGCLPAQDYRPYAYVWFHTDTAHLDEYAERVSAAGAERIHNTEKDPADYFYGEDDVRLLIPDGLPWWVYELLCRHLSDDLDGSEVYNYQSGGCLFNYSTGLAVFWV